LLQQDVEARMASLGLAPVAEWVEPKTGYSVDLAVEKERVLVEVDGPYHFAHNSRYPLGATRLKRKILRLATRGEWHCVCVPYWAWNTSSASSSASGMAAAEAAEAEEEERRRRSGGVVVEEAQMREVVEDVEGTRQSPARRHGEEARQQIYLRKMLRLERLPG
jgi:hypothetical protein